MGLYEFEYSECRKSPATYFQDSKSWSRCIRRTGLEACGCCKLHIVRLTLPTRIPLSKTFVFASVFFCVQQIEHTNIFFSLLYYAFLILSVVTFNLAEGFTRLTGAYTFWYSTLIAIVGVTWKAVVGEPANSNLFSPLLDMSLYTTSMVMLLMVTLVNRKMDFRSMGFGGGFSKSELNYTSAGLGCLVVFLVIIYANVMFGQAPGSIVSALVQVNVFGQLGLILATIGAVRDSGGRRSTSTISIVGFTYFAYLGVASFSKQAMIGPMVCWLVGALYSRLKLRFVHVVAMILMVVTAFGFVSPLSASRDLSENLDYPGRIALAANLLVHYSVLHAHVKQLEEQEALGGVNNYYDKPQGSLIERLSMIPPDDELFTYTAQGHYEGLAPVFEYFGNLVPHVFNPNKKMQFSGNYYAHEMGAGLSEEDYSTGISYSPVAEAYHCLGWGGILWLLPVIWLILFSTVDFVVGDMTKYPWGLMVVVWFAHAAPETLLGGMVYFIGYGNFGMLVAIVVVTRIAPIIGALFSGRVPSPPPRRLNSARPVVAQTQG
jgi:hypothetical protein